MEYLIVLFDEDREVIVSPAYFVSPASGAWRTNQVLMLEPGTYTVELAPPANYTPPRIEFQLVKTTVREPLEIRFTKIESTKQSSADASRAPRSQLNDAQTDDRRTSSEDLPSQSTPAQQAADLAAIFKQLGPISIEALEIAEGERRAGRKDRVHSEDLVLGLLDSKDQRVRESVGRLSLDEVRSALEESSNSKIPPSYSKIQLETMPRVSAHVREAMAIASAMIPRSQKIEPQHLMYGVLSVPNCSLATELQKLGLKKDNLFEPTFEVSIAGYSADDADGLTDELGIDRDVNAICSLLAAKDLIPPLSIGLFGNWGSGKTVFMRRMKRRIEAIDAMAGTNPQGAYCQHIVQLWFNAWHYIDTDLWASLASEIFEGLAGQLADKNSKNPELVKMRLLQAAEGSLKKKEDAEETVRQCDEKLSKIEARILSLDPREVLEAALNQGQVKQEIQQAATTLGLDETVVQREIVEMSDSLGGVRAFWLWVSAGDSRKKLVVLIAMVTVPVVVSIFMGLLLKHADLFRPVVANVLGAIAGFATFVAAIVKPVVRVLTILKPARISTDELIKKKKEEDEKRKDPVRAEKVQAQRRAKEAEEELEKIQQNIRELSAAQRLSNFITDRYRSTDYTQRLGVISAVHRDFERLSEFLAAKKSGLGDDLPIDRIILYIDDLDRCPEDKVVDVLQAVHLLLAFPLFVVVVGVDSRWLVHSLRGRSVVFKQERDVDSVDAHWRSTPLNYLEKIFQIPFALRPMGEMGFANLVKTLTEEKTAKHLGSAVKAEGSSSTNDKAEGSNTDGSSSTNDKAEGSNIEGSSSTIESNPEHLRLESREREYMQKLGILIQTPRGAKRFVNIYRLMRAALNDRERHSLLGEPTGYQGQYPAVLLLLAIMVGYPDASVGLLNAIVENNDDTDFWQLISPTPKLDPEPASSPQASDSSRSNKFDNDANWQELAAKLELIRPEIPGVSWACKDLGEWAHRVARYSFRSGQEISPD